MKRTAIACVAAGALLLILGSPAFGDDPDCPDPCPRFTYVLAYRTSDGFIRAGVGWNPVGDPLGGGVPMDLPPGEAFLDFSGDPRIVDIFNNPDNYHVDVATGTIMEGPAGPDRGWPAGSVLIGFGPAGAIVGLIALKRFSRRRRQGGTG